MLFKSLVWYTRCPVHRIHTNDCSAEINRKIDVATLKSQKIGIYSFLVAQINKNKTKTNIHKQTSEQHTHKNNQ